MSPMPQHCIDCDKVASVIYKDIFYCADCGIKEQQKDNDGKRKQEK